MRSQSRRRQGTGRRQAHKLRSSVLRWLLASQSASCAAGCLAASRDWRHTNWLFSSPATPMAWIQRGKHKLTPYVKLEPNSREAHTNWRYTSNINWIYCASFTRWISLWYKHVLVENAVLLRNHDVHGDEDDRMILVSVVIIDGFIFNMCVECVLHSCFPFAMF